MRMEGIVLALISLNQKIEILLGRGLPNDDVTDRQCWAILLHIGNVLHITYYLHFNVIRYNI